MARKTTKKPQAKKVVKRSKLAQAKRAFIKAKRSSYPLHKRLILHPLNVFFLLCVGVLLVALTAESFADTTISAVIAPALTEGAVITTPTDSAVFTQPTITVNGTCPLDAYVNVSVNQLAAGTALCDSDDTFTITISLYEGSNDIQAQDYNMADTAGPTTDSITVTYNKPAPPDTSTTTTPPTTTPDDTATIPPVTTTSTTTDTSTPPPLLLTTNFTFYTFKVDTPFTWTMNVQGGTPPYTVSVDWGDGKTSVMTFATPTQAFTVDHSYTTPGNYHPIVKSVDSTSTVRTVQLAALITDKAGNAPFLTQIERGGIPHKTNTQTKHGGLTIRIGSGLTAHTIVLLAWVPYSIVLLMLVSFWLGERREFLMVHHAPHFKKPVSRRRRR